WWRLPPNHLVWVALAALVAAQWCAVSWSPLARLLGTVPLAAADWLVVAAALAGPLGARRMVRVRLREFGVLHDGRDGLSGATSDRGDQGRGRCAGIA